MYSINNCKDEVRNADVEHQNEFNIDVNHRYLISTMQEKNGSLIKYSLIIFECMIHIYQQTLGKVSF